MRRIVAVCLFVFAVVPLALAQTPLRLKNVTPCRLVDTRPGSGGAGPIPGGTFVTYNLPSLAESGGAYHTCTPFSLSTAQAYSLNVTLVPNGPVDFLTIWPTGEPQPLVSLMNSDGRTKANAAIVPAGTPDGEVNVYVTNTTNVLIDIDAYFDSASDTSALAFFPLTPCRIIDTRNGQDGGTLPAGQTTSYTIPTHCGVPSYAQAYSFNVTVLPSAGGLDFLTVWPKGGTIPVVSTLNAGTSDPAVANAAIVPAGSDNATSFYPHSNSTNLLLDVDGYFAPASSASGPLSLYTLTPCRILDTRSGFGLFNGTIPVGIVGSLCGIPNVAQAFSLNATVVPGNPPAGFLTLWPEGLPIPTVSTLNAYDGAVTSNMAIVPAGTGNDSINAFADNSSGGTTQLILDTSSYFAPIAAVDVISTTLPEGTQNVSYGYQLVATGGIPPYTWAITSGSLPSGMHQLSSGGLLSGTPTATGTFPFTVQATDSAGNNAPAAHLTLIINTSAGTPAITSPAELNGTINTPFSALLTANGGFTPYTWSVVTGSLPVGLSLNASTGLISGVPGAAGLTNLVVQVTDSQNNTSRQDLVVAINTGNANGTLNGMYAGSFAGYDEGNWFVAAFSITADGDGHITAGEVDSNHVSGGVKHATIVSGTGSTYTVGSNGLGTINWTDSEGGTVSLLVSTGTGEDMRIISFNQNGTGGTWGAGVLRQQNPYDFTGAALAGKWAYGLQGFDPSGDAFAADGTYQESASGAVTSGLEDYNDFGTHNGSVPFTGEITSAPDANGRATVEISINGLNIHEAAYVVSSSRVALVDIDAGGYLFLSDALRQSGTFGIGSFNGEAVGGASRVHYSSSGSTAPDATVVLIGGAGNGNISITADDNQGGDVSPLNSQEFGTYSVASNSRAVVTLSTGAQLACYLVATNEGFCINAVPQSGNNDKGAEVTYFEPQSAPAGGFSAASFSGEYLGGSLPQYTSTPFSQVDTNVSSGASTFASTFTTSGPGGTTSNQTLSGTYNINATSGAITISVGGNPVYAGYMVSPTKVEYITVTSGSTPLVLIENTSAAPRH